MLKPGLSAFFLLLPWFLNAQEIIHYDISSGLSSIEVNDIKENENFLWIATSDGLNRFDGENFKIYKRDNLSANAISENNIEALFFDSRGLLWIGLKTGGADIYDPRQDRFTNLKNVINGTAPARVITFAEDSEHNIWLGTWEEGVYKLIPDSRNPMSYKVEAGYPGYIVSAIIEKPKGYIRIGTYYGSFVYNMKRREWTDVGHTDKAITQFLETGDDHSLWCSTWSSGLFEAVWDNNAPESMNISRNFSGEKFNSLHRILADSDQGFYIGTWGEGMKYTKISHPERIRQLAPGKIEAPLINCLFRDKFRNIWIGTYGNGIYKFNPGRNFIQHLPENGPLPAPAISLAEFNDNQVFIGTQGKGVYLYDIQNLTLAPEFGNLEDGEFTNYILALYSDKKYVFAGHDGQGIAYQVKDTPAAGIGLVKYRGIVELDKATAFLPDENGRVWIGTKQNGLFSARLNSGPDFLDEFIHHESFGRDEITGIVRMDDHQLFISSHNGLFLFNTISDQISRNGTIMENEIVYRIARDDKNKCLWIGGSARLLRISLNEPGTVQEVLPQDILPQAAIRVLILDDHNNLWFAIREKLFCLADNEKRVCEINPALLGIRAILSGAGVNIRGKQQLVFGTTDDLVTIDPEDLLNQPNHPAVLFTGLEIDHRKVGVGEKVYGNIVLNEAPEYTRSIKLSYKCKWITLSFTDTEWGIYKNKYQYRVKGFHNDWQNIDLSNPVMFSNLAPGRYSIEIRKYDLGENPEISWSLQTIVLPPWWKTNWFFTLVSMTVITLISLVILLIRNYYRRRHLMKLNEIEKQKHEELLREKESFITGLSHELMTPFSLILSPVNDLLRENFEDDQRKEKLEIISKNTSFLADIFRSILDFKRAEFETAPLRESNIEVVSLSWIVLNGFEYLANSRKIDLSFNSSHDSLNILTDNVKVEKILYNLLSNAVRFTPDGGSVSLNLQYDGSGRLAFVILDNGCGMDIANQSRIFEKFYRIQDIPGIRNPRGLGLGLYIVKKFVTQLNGEISVNSAPGRGTEIRVDIPVRLSPQDDTQGFEKHVLSMNGDLSTVLIVENNDQMREYISRKLASNFNVISVSGIDEAIKGIEKFLPEIIVADDMTPEADGMNLCRQIKGNGRYFDLFVVILSAKTSPGDELLAYQSGADIYIKKPLDLEVLLTQLINIQGTRQRRKSQLFAKLVSKESPEIEFDAKESFLKHSMQVIEDHIMDSSFNIDEFAKEMNMSNTVLHRKFKLLVGQTPNQFIRLVRLRKSVSLLKTSDHTIAEIAYLTGFNHSHYYIKCFREVYNETPKGYREKNNL